MKKLYFSLVTWSIKMPKDYCLVLFTTFDLAYRIGGLVEQSVEQNTKASCSWEAWKVKKKIYPACGHIIVYACLTIHYSISWLVALVQFIVKRADSLFCRLPLTRIFFFRYELFWDSPQGLQPLMHLSFFYSSKIYFTCKVYLYGHKVYLVYNSLSCSSLRSC